jgi:hypothetical protein
MPQRIQNDAVLVRADGVIGRDLGSSGILVNLETNAIFEVNTTGGRIWALLADGASAHTIANQLTREFDVDLPAAETEVTTILGRFEAEGLVRRRS